MAYMMNKDRLFHTVVETPEFLRQVRGLLGDEERRTLVDLLAADPQAGVAMEGTGGARKLRIAARGKGKSGGARAITFYAGSDLPVFLMAIFGKGDKANMSKAERNELKSILAQLARNYRKG
jgi:hypothetical protein